MAELVDQAIAVLLLSLRLAPTFAFAPPFTLTRVPALVRLILCVSIAGWMAAGNPEASWASDYRSMGLPLVAASELFLGIVMALALQLAFGMVAMIGRSIDIQAGFGLALLIDPTTRAQSPLIGTLLAYGAAAVFFLTTGPADVLAMFAISLKQVPLGMMGLPERVTPLLNYISVVSVMALGLVGVLLLALFLIDLAVALMSRTMPQMNVLLLGFQVKAIATLALLPLTLGLAAAGFAQLLRVAIDAPLLFLG